MRPGENPPDGGQPNPYRQPGYRQPNPYQQPAPWDAPTVTAGATTPPPPSGGGSRTRIVAIAAAAAVVIASGVTGFALLGGDGDDGADPGPTASPTRTSSPSGDDRARDDGPKPTVAGWKSVVNPERGIAFDVPSGWNLKSTSWATFVTDPDDKPLIGFRAPAFIQEKWCGSDDDRDGTKEYSPLGAAGTRRVKGARNTEEAARENAATWVYGAFAQPDRKLVTSGPVTSYTTKSGIKGSLATASSSGVEKKQKCDSDGKATVFAFEDPSGDIVSWAFFGAKGVSDEVSDATVRKIVATVRLYDDPTGS
ncbi:hypothetical protein ACFY93_16450 [Streptomyces sp. NPDC008313]|uniref:hypothetical protein n=1 Tax=Streptomyces sp. NPDC008313 TaxID=3364826 RepID=UPI0036E24EB3